MNGKTKTKPIITELFILGRKLFHHTIILLCSKLELQQIVFSHSSYIGFDKFM